MPASKKPRKKKRNTMQGALTMYNGMAKIKNMMLIPNKEHVINQCIKLMFECDKLLHQELNAHIFCRLISMLVTGKVLANKLPLDPDDRRKFLISIEMSAYMLFVTMRLRAKDVESPAGNIQIIKEGLAASQDLFRFAQDNYGDIFLQAIYASMGKEEESMDEKILRHKYLLGERWGIVYEWVNRGEIMFEDVPPSQSN